MALDSLRGDRDFRKVRAHGQAIRDPLFTLRVTEYRPRHGEAWQPRAIIGIVVSKPNATTAVVQYHGEAGGFVGLTPGARVGAADGIGEQATTTMATTRNGSWASASLVPVYSSLYWNRLVNEISEAPYPRL